MFEELQETMRGREIGMFRFVSVRGFEAGREEREAGGDGGDSLPNCAFNSTKALNAI